MQSQQDGTTYTGPTDGGWQRGAIINHYSSQCWGACNGTDNNGNLKQQDHWIPDINGAVQGLFIQNYTYDNLNRLQRVNEGSNWQQEFVYDHWGNRTIHLKVSFRRVRRSMVVKGCFQAAWFPRKTSTRPNLVSCMRLGRTK